MQGRNRKESTLRHGAGLLLLRLDLTYQDRNALFGIPLAFHLSTGSELHRPLAMVYIGGFLGAVLQRMIAVPLFYGSAAATRKQPGT